MTHTQMFVVLTVSAPADDEVRQLTIARTVSVSAGATRAELYTWARNQCPPAFADANVLFFSAEPNLIALPGAVSR
ncbi:hypothetical protein Ssi03_76920 [Sphaerisporangium siamense]|uniref:Uncharacterized protein n=1 Tax=Sphaerisporangium siamense TaxID=795645 RepID=A0A7W7GCK5_9ACTN|nr:hypothetical protein [Sphaerisporangium siamense]MBB4706178.1 hypothetical protein [Sphaerisporangium siamense]GII89702.1 hypothetical protein Ssi03_76920 [Sphaerisporangium siamense]